MCYNTCYYFHQCPHKHRKFMYLPHCYQPNPFLYMMRSGDMNGVYPSMSEGMGPSPMGTPTSGSECPDQGPPMSEAEVKKVAISCKGRTVCVWLVTDNIISGKITSYDDDSVTIKGHGPILFHKINSIKCMDMEKTELPSDFEEKPYGQGPYDEDGGFFPGYGDDIGMRQFDGEEGPPFEEEYTPGEGGPSEGTQYNFEVDQLPSTEPPGYEPGKPYYLTTGTIKDALRRCGTRWTFVWLKNGQKFWLYITRIKGGDVAGYRGRRRNTYFATEADNIETITCEVRDKNFVCPFMDR